MLPAELIQRILLLTNDLKLEVAIAIELLLAPFSRPFGIRINADSAKGPIRDAVEPLLPEAWNGIGESDFPASLAVSRSLVVEPDGDVETTPAFRLAWVCKFRPDLITYKYVMRAAGAGRLDLVRILDAFEVPRFCMGTMDEAAAAGHFAIVKYLHFNRTEGCTSWAMTRAAKGGFLDIVLFLHANRTEGCRDSALIDAAAGGYFEIVSFLQKEYLFFPDTGREEYGTFEDIPTSYIRRLHEEFGWPITERVAFNVMVRGTADEFRYCLAKLPATRRSRSCMLDIVKKAKKPFLENFRILFEAVRDDDQFWDRLYVDYLAINGQLEVLQFLYERRTERCSRNGLSEVALHGQVDVFKYLLTHADTMNEIDNYVLGQAAAGGSVEILKALRAANIPALEQYWPFQTGKAHQNGRVDAVRYLSTELGFPVTRVVHFDKRNAPDPDEFDNRIFDLEPEHGPSGQRALFLHACKFGTLEQVARLSTHVPECQLAFEGDRWNFLGYCWEQSLWNSVEVVKFLVKELRMRPDLNVLNEAASHGRLDHLKFLYDYLPADAPLDELISWAITHGEFEAAKFLHMKRRATGQLKCLLSPWEKDTTNMDVTTFLIENYLPQITVSEAIRSVWNPYFHNFDVFKYIMEGGYLNDCRCPFPWDTMVWRRQDQIQDLDCLRHGLRANLFESDSFSMETDHYPHLSIVGSRQVSIVRVFWETFPERFTRETALAVVKRDCLPLLRYLSHVAPHLFDDSVVSAAISESKLPLEQTRFLLDRHPECVKWNEHLELAVIHDTPTAMLLWERWPGGCPRKAMEIACGRRDTQSLKTFLERMDPGHIEWRVAVDECLSMARKSDFQEIVDLLLPHRQAPADEYLSLSKKTDFQENKELVLQHSQTGSSDTCAPTTARVHRSTFDFQAIQDELFQISKEENFLPRSQTPGLISTNADRRKREKIRSRKGNKSKSAFEDLQSIRDELLNIGKE
ncbi:hypothetical protein HDU96_001244 [Phlyctochytrium bullatum]|nr:hypothetical protein HDU96_001244 [Phlyctochytrium bullatum]